jgi:hypothetical protein
MAIVYVSSSTAGDHRIKAADEGIKPAKVTSVIQQGM